MDKTVNCFIKDIYASAFLLATGKRLIGLQKDGNFYWFVFEDKLACEQLLDEYWRGEGMVSPRSYADACRTLKDRIFSQK